MIKTILIIPFIFALSFTHIFAQSYNAEVLKYSTTCNANEDKLSQIDSVTIQINNRLGDKYTDISIPFSKSIKVSEIKAWIETSDGVIVRELKKNEMIEKSAISDISLYEDNFIKTFQLKHNIYPYKVIYTYKTTYHQFLSIANWTPIIEKDIPTRNAKLKVITPTNYPIKQYCNNIGKPNIDSTDISISYEWQSTYNRIVKPEIFSDSEFQIPTVHIVPLNFEYGIEGSFKSWQSYGNWQYRLNEGQNILPEQEVNTVNSLIGNTKDKKEIARILYHYLQDHTRYINVSIGIGGMKSYPADYVATNKYGDCKALSNYMQSLLKYAGIESFYTMVYSGDQPVSTTQDFPNQQFNHIILAVPIDNDTIWLDNTSKINPFGYLGSFSQNRDALLVSKENSKLVKIPALKPDQNKITTKIAFDLQLKGDAIATINNEYRGSSFEWFSQINTSFNEDQKNQIIREYMPFNNYEVVNWEIKKANRDTAQINLNATLNLYKIIRSLGNEYYVNLYPTHLPAFQVPANRIRPLAIPYPICSSDTLVYKIPSGFELKNQLDPVTINGRYGNYIRSSKIIDSNLYIIKNMLIQANNYSPEQYADFYSFIQSIKDSDKNSPIILKPIIKN